MCDSPYDIKSALEITKRLYEIEQESTIAISNGRERDLLLEKEQLLQELQHIYDDEHEENWIRLSKDSETILHIVSNTFQEQLVRKNSKFLLQNKYYDKNPWIKIHCPILTLKGNLNFKDINIQVEEIVNQIKSKVFDKFDVKYTVSLVDNTKKNVQFHLELFFVYK